MKFKNIFAVALATIALASCTDDDKTYPINTAPGVTVEMGETEITVVENQGLFNVPIVVNGEPNGYIEITIKVRDGEWSDENETEPAIDDANYYITTKTLRIAPETKTAYIEVNTQDDDEENYTRVFYMSIEKADGATVASADNYTQINIKNKSLFNKMGGTWYLTYTDYDGVASETKCTMVATDPNEEYCYLTGLMDDMLQAQFKFNYDRETESATLDFVYGYTMASGLNFGDFLGDVVALNMEAGTTGTIPGVMKNEYTEVDFPEGSGFYIGVFNEGSYMGLMDLYENLHLSRSSKSGATE